MKLDLNQSCRVGVCLTVLCSTFCYSAECRKDLLLLTLMVGCLYAEINLIGEVGFDFYFAQVSNLQA